MNSAEKQRFINDLNVIPPLNEQAKLNLTGNARDLWITGIRDIKAQSDVLAELKNETTLANDPEVLTAIENALTSTNELVSWLEAEAETKTGPSGIGKDHYTWYLQTTNYRLH